MAGKGKDRVKISRCIGVDPLGTETEGNMPTVRHNSHCLVTVRVTEIMKRELKLGWS